MCVCVCVCVCVFFLFFFFFFVVVLFCFKIVKIMKNRLTPLPMNGIFQMIFFFPEIMVRTKSEALMYKR